MQLVKTARVPLLMNGNHRTACIHAVLCGKQAPVLRVMDPPIRLGV